MGRSKLKHLKQTTLKTFFVVCKDWGIKNGRDFKYNSIDGYIMFANGSEILLKDLFAYPSDPNFDSLGSLEITGYFIDECNQIVKKAKDIVSSRVRYRVEEFGLIPKGLLTCNPDKGWVYDEFYKPSRDGTLEKSKKFLPALVTDNPFIDPHYIKQLRKLTGAAKERLLYGNWEYDDDPARLFEYDALIDMFGIVLPEAPRKHREPRIVACDVARLGQDKTVIFVLHGLQVVDCKVILKSTTDYVCQVLRDTCAKHEIGHRQVVVDEVGLGAGVVDHFKGCRGFVANHKPVVNENCANLKTECFLQLSEFINKGRIGFSHDKYRERIIAELEAVRLDNLDKDQKLKVERKDAIKERLGGKSPDFADALAMAMVFYLSETPPGSLKKINESLREEVKIGGTVVGNIASQKF